MHTRHVRVNMRACIREGVRTQTCVNSELGSLQVEESELLERAGGLCRLDQLRQLGDLCMPRMRSSGPEDKRLAVDESERARETEQEGRHRQA
jgi:hypothetical protein